MDHLRCLRLGDRQTKIAFHDRESLLKLPSSVSSEERKASPGSGESGRHPAEERLSSPALWVFDEKTASLFSRNFPEFAGKTDGNPVPRVVLPEGEQGKNWNSVEQILETALDRKLGRDSLICGVGGGVVCDMAAFAASVYMRGCRLLLFPTTLLAMADAAVGGKTGMDFRGYKNMVGSFYPAEEVRLWLPALSSLPAEEYLSGLGEIFKAALLRDDNGLLELLETRKEDLLNRDPELLRSVLRRAVAVKADIVEEDFKETGRRAFLNLGHTFAHALETVSGFSRKHGHAVVWGIDRALHLGCSLGLTDPAYRERVRTLFREYGYCLEYPLAPEPFLEAMEKDKKNSGSSPRKTLRLVLQKNRGDTRIVSVDQERIRRILSRPVSGSN